ncbi:hypothetical protein F4825DRAFT_437204 [Nemania diffusa]|nr:hypothetical protein F4825DRAFT_437204 [Nemania diffusa]
MKKQHHILLSAFCILCSSTGLRSTWYLLTYSSLRIGRQVSSFASDLQYYSRRRCRCSANYSIRQRPLRDIRPTPPVLPCLRSLGYRRGNFSTASSVIGYLL